MNILVQNSRVLIWEENTLEEIKKKKNPNNKQVLDLSCMLEGKRKGRWKRPSF